MAVGQAISSLGPIALVPLFLTTWGASFYGEWLTMSSTVAYLATLDVGMQTYVINRLAECCAEDNLAEYNRIVQSAFVMSVSICSGGTLLMLTFLWIAPVSSWLHLQDLSPFVLRGTLGFLSLQVIATVPLNLTLGIYRTFGEFHRGIMVGNVQRVATLVATGAVLLLKGTMLAAAGMQFAPVVLAFLFVVSDTRSRYPAIRLFGGEWSVGICRTLISPSLMFFGAQLAYIVTLQGGPLILAMRVGPVSVATFVTLRTLANVIRQAAQSLRVSMWPEITTLAASGQWNLVRELHQKSARFLLALSGSLALFFFMAGKWLVPLWTRNRLQFEPKILLPLLLVALFEGWWGSSALILMATNRIKSVTICYLSSAVISVAVGLFLVGICGAAGVAMAILFGDLMTSAWYLPHRVMHLLKENLWRYLMDSWAPFVLVAFAQLIVLVAFQRYWLSPTPIGRLLAMGAATAFIWSALYPMAVWRGNTARELARVWSKFCASV